jgi:hypothetical protein
MDYAKMWSELVQTLLNAQQYGLNENITVTQALAVMEEIEKRNAIEKMQQELEEKAVKESEKKPIEKNIKMK